MDHSCYRCNTSIEEGTVFCPHCNAPLIRVAVAEPPADSIPAPEKSSAQIPRMDAVFHQNPETRMEWAHALSAATLAGVLAAVLMVSSQGAFGFGLFACGALSVVFFRRRNPNANLTLWKGVQLGALSGFIGFGISAAFITIVTLFSGTERVRNFLVETATEAAARTSNPDQRQLFEYFKTPTGLPGMLVICLIVFFVIFLLFSAAGGAIGAAWLRRRRRS